MDFLCFGVFGLLLHFVGSKGLPKWNICFTNDLMFSCRCSVGHPADMSGFTWDTEGGLAAYIKRGWVFYLNGTNSNTLSGTAPPSAVNDVVVLRCGIGSPMQIMNIVPIVALDPLDANMETDEEEYMYVTNPVIEATCDSTDSASNTGYKFMTYNNVPIDGAWQKKHQVSIVTNPCVFNKVQMNVNVINRNRLMTIYCQKDDSGAKVKAIRMFIMNNVKVFPGKGFLEQTCPLTLSEKTLSCQGLVWTGVSDFRWYKLEGTVWDLVPNKTSAELQLQSVNLADTYRCQGRISERKWQPLVEFHFGDSPQLVNTSYVCDPQTVKKDSSNQTEQTIGDIDQQTQRTTVTLIGGVTGVFVVVCGGVMVVVLVIFLRWKRRRRERAGTTGTADPTIPLENVCLQYDVDNG